MEWIAKIVEKEKVEGEDAVILTIEFSKGEQVLTRKMKFGLGFSMQQVKNQIRYRIQQLDALDVTIDAIELNTPVDSSESPEAVESKELLNNISELQRRKQLHDLGVFTETDLPMEGLKSKIKKSYKKVYDIK